MPHEETDRHMVPYRLKSGRLIQVDDSAAKGARVTTFQEGGGAVVNAYRVLPPLELMQRIEATGYECEGGPLAMNLYWFHLKCWIEEQMPSRPARPGEYEAYIDDQITDPEVSR
jgi:hypothetical protein